MIPKIRPRNAGALTLAVTVTVPAEALKVTALLLIVRPFAPA
jgi:hypothetical protein